MGASEERVGRNDDRAGSDAVVCGLDGSAEAHSAARVAKLLADRLDLRLVLVCVAAPVTQPGVSAARHGQERLADDERREAERLLGEAAAEIEAPDAELRVEFGSAADGILRVAEAEEAAFVVVGTRGRGGVKAALLGSVSRSVAARARCPVVLVPH